MRSKRPRYTWAASISRTAEKDAEHAADGWPLAGGASARLSARVPPEMTAKKIAAMQTITASVISQPASSSQAGSVKK